MHNQLLRAWNARAPIYSAHGDHESALADWQSCIDNTEGIEQANHRLCQAIAFVKAGQAERAMETMEAVLVDLPTDTAHPMRANVHYNLACIQSLIAGQTEDADRRLNLLTQAADSVSAALEHGWQPINQLRADSDLQALQNFVDFQPLLMDWEK